MLLRASSFADFVRKSATEFPFLHMLEDPSCINLNVDLPQCGLARSDHVFIYYLQSKILGVLAPLRIVKNIKVFTIFNKYLFELFSSLSILHPDCQTQRIDKLNY